MKKILFLRSQGHTLIEVIISIGILTIGIIGAIHLQLASIRAAQHSHFYSTAVTLASELSEEIRSNSDQVGSENTIELYSHITFDAKHDSPSSSLPSAHCYGSVANCTSSMFAGAFISDWLKRVALALPAARVVVCNDDDPYDTEKNGLRWECTGGDKDNLVIKIGWQSTGDDTLTSEQRGQVIPLYAGSVLSLAK